MTEPGLYWDPYDEGLDDHPYPVWQRLRAEMPVYRNERYDFWALSRFGDVEAASKDSATYSSAHGTVLEQMGPAVDASGMMIFKDPPGHTQFRTLVSRAFTPRRIGALEARIHEHCRDLLDPHAGSSRFDFVEAFAAQLPSRVISTLVGVPPEDQEEQRRNVDGMFHIEPDVGMSNQKSAECALALISYLSELARERARVPRDDLISALVTAEVTEPNGAVHQLTPDECVGFSLLLYAAGTETVAKLLGNAAVILALYPDQRASLASQPSLIPNAVEELLRFEPPSPVNGRWTTRPVELHGVTIPAESKVLLLTGSAGRDERAFSEPDRFDIHRRLNHHLSFGYGPHFCLGAALARLESRIGLHETLIRFPEWQVEVARLERAHTSTVRGYRSVVIEV